MFVHIYCMRAYELLCGRVRCSFFYRTAPNARAKNSNIIWESIIRCLLPATIITANAIRVERWRRRRRVHKHSPQALKAPLVLRAVLYILFYICTWVYKAYINMNELKEKNFSFDFITHGIVCLCPFFNYNRCMCVGWDWLYVGAEKWKTILGYTRW